MLVMALATVATAAAPALAGHPDGCGDDRTLVAEGGGVSVYAWDAPCAGVEAERASRGCLRVAWGAHVDAAGVGGHSTCDAHDYVALP